MIVPLVVIRPILLPKTSVNHRFPSGPAVMPSGELRWVGMGNWLNRVAALAPGPTKSTLAKTSEATSTRPVRLGRTRSITAHPLTCGLEASSHTRAHQSRVATVAAHDPSSGIS